MDLGVSNTVVKRNALGQFRQHCLGAAEATIEDMVTDGAKLSRQLAPSGSKDDPRTPKLKESIEPVVFSRTSGAWVAAARHALPIEFGAAPHGITGRVRFFWDRMGRWWVPGDNTIHHPDGPVHARSQRP
jgi:hypothetical protein